MMRYPRIQKVSVFFAVVVFFALCPHYAQAGNWSLWTNVGAGDSSSITGDITLRYAFSPLYQNSSIKLRPLGEASAVYWQHETDNDEWGGGLSVGLQLVFFRNGSWRPYFSGVIGGFLVSDNDFGSQHLGGVFQFRSKAALGFQFGQDFKHRIQIDAAHFSNAGIYDRNSGFNTFGISYGFRF